MAKKAKMEEDYADVVINSLMQEDFSLLPPKEEKTEAASPEGEEEERQATITARNKMAGRETPEKRKCTWQEYEREFVRESGVTARRGRQVYVRAEYHERIMKIIQVIGGSGISMASYIDNVLTAHFEEHGGNIAESFNRHLKSFNV